MLVAYDTYRVNVWEARANLREFRVNFWAKGALAPTDDRTNGGRHRANLARERLAGDTPPPFHRPGTVGGRARGRVRTAR